MFDTFYGIQRKHWIGFCFLRDNVELGYKVFDGVCQRPHHRTIFWLTRSLPTSKLQIHAQDRFGEIAPSSRKSILSGSVSEIFVKRSMMYSRSTTPSIYVSTGELLARIPDWYSS